MPHLGSGTTDDPYRPDPAYAVADLPGDRVPDFRLEHYDPKAESGLRPATADEIAAYDLSQPKFLNTRDLFRRMTAAEQFFLFSAAAKDPNACALFLKLITDSTTDVHSAEWQQGVSFFVPAGVAAGIWPDQAAAAKRVAEITA